MVPSTQTECVGVDKVQILIKQESVYTNGKWSDWNPIGNVQGEVLEYNSPDCGGTGENDEDKIFKWEIDKNDPYTVCSGTTEYYAEKKYFSTNGGKTWYAVEPAEYRNSGQIKQTNSENCSSGGGTYQERWVVVEGEYMCADDIAINIDTGTDLNLKILQMDCEHITIETNAPTWFPNPTSFPAEWLVYEGESTSKGSNYWNLSILNDSENNGNVWGKDRKTYFIIKDNQVYNSNANWLRFSVVNVAHVDGKSNFRLYISKVESRTSTQANGGNGSPDYSEWTTVYTSDKLVC